MQEQPNPAHKKATRQVQKVVKYYQNQYPKIGQLVMVQCVSSVENGFYVQLLEYERKKGMVPINQCSKSMVKYLQRAIKVGRVQAARVIKVDANKGYIDLSKSKVNAEDQKQAQERYAQSKALHSILINIAKNLEEVASIYKNIIWPMYAAYPNSHPHDLIKTILVKQEKAEELGFTDPKLKQNMINELKRRYKRNVVKYIAIFKVAAVRHFDGILKIKEILRAGAEASKQKQLQVKITILGAPDYLCEISTATKEEGEQAIMLALNKIKEQAEKINGEFQIKQKPKVVGDSHHAIHQIYAEEMENGDDVNDDDQMGDQIEA